jgi:Domain of unknown function (DUF1906)/FG-GAP-like repeat
MNVLQGVHRRVPRRSSLATTAVAVAIALVAGVAIWFTIKPADAATVQPGAYTGLGFDACTAPKSDVMAAWRASSPYRAIGIYIGGTNRGCAQPELDADWVTEQQQAGWHLMPLYVGLQAACSTSTTLKKLSNAQAGTQGRDAGADAVAKATDLGLAPNSMLIYDMEAYPTTDADCEAGVMAFMSAWTIRLHEAGYASGFYSSMGSGVAHQVDNYFTRGYARPDYVDFARWDNVATASDVGIPDGYWTPSRRIKQFAGDHVETWGGKSINIDTDYLDVTPMSAAGFSDFTGNGFADVMARNSTNGQLILYPGHASMIQSGKTVGTGWNVMNSIIRIGDLNGDGYEDMIARRATTGALLFYPGTGSGFGKSKQIGSSWSGMRELTPIGDFTGDGVPDLLAIQSSTSTLYVYPGKSNVSLGTRIQVGVRWSGLSDLAGVGDFDRDGKPDFVGKVTATGELRLFSGRSKTFSGRSLETGWSDRRDLVGVGDFDRDGYPDLAAIGKTDAALRVYRGNGTGFQGNFRIGVGFGALSPLF